MLALILLVFVSLVLAGYALFAGASRRLDARDAFQRRLPAATGGGKPSRPGSLLKDRRLSTIAVLNAVLGRLSLVAPVAEMIRKAGLKRRVGEILLYVPLLASTAFLLTILATGSLAGASVAAAGAGGLPLLVVQHLRRQRTRLFAEQLPDALDLVRAALQAGHGLLSAMGVVAAEFPDPIAQEFRDVTEEVRLGLPLRDALANLARRVDNDDFPLLQVGVLVTQEVGGNLTEVLDKIGHTIRERFKLQREMAVLTAQGRMSGRVLTALPFVAALGMSFLNPTYFGPMLEDPTGRAMLMCGGVSLFVGHLIIRRLVRIVAA